MKNPCSSRLASAAFTLIELLTVMAIIVILAGLILGTAGYANNKAASARTVTEIKGFDSAINAYQVDNGTVPRSNDTDTLDARANAQGAGNPTAYQKASLFLFKALSGFFDMSTGAASPPQWVSNGANSRPKAYFPFKATQLVENPAAQNGKITPGNVQYIVDPFGESYGYGTAAAKEADNASPGSAQSKGYNPVFDVWSTAGYGLGKPYPTNPAPTDKTVLWLTDWASQ